MIKWILELTELMKQQNFYLASLFKFYPLNGIKKKLQIQLGLLIQY